MLLIVAFMHTQVVGVAATFTGVWLEVAGLIAELDVLGGFADLAAADPTRPYCKPEILERDAGELVIKVRVQLCFVPHVFRVFCGTRHA